MAKRARCCMAEASDRFSPSRDSLDSGFESGPCSPGSSALSTVSEEGPAGKKARPDLDAGRAKLGECEVDFHSASVKCASGGSGSTGDEHDSAHSSGASTSAEARTRCAWDACSRQCADVNDLFDHVTSGHLEPLRQLVAAAGGARPDPFTCMWPGCEMTLERGTAEKKLDWLCAHFHARHAARAQPFRCLISECTVRFSSQKALTSHLRHSHDNKPVRKPQPATEPAQSCFQYKQVIRNSQIEALDFMDDRTFSFIAHQLSNMLKEEPTMPVMHRGSAGCVSPKKAVKVLRGLFPSKVRSA